MKLMSFTALVALTTFASTAGADGFMLDDIAVADPMAFETARIAQTAGGFMIIANNGDTDERLIAVEADFPRVEIHITEMDGDIARMIHQQDGITIPAGETVTFEPGGLHVMFMGLGGDPFEVDEEIPATLVFENAGRLDVVFTVAARDTDAQGRMGHSGMDHSGSDK